MQEKITWVAHWPKHQVVVVESDHFSQEDFFDESSARRWNLYQESGIQVGVIWGPYTASAHAGEKKPSEPLQRMIQELRTLGRTRSARGKQADQREKLGLRALQPLEECRVRPLNHRGKAFLSAHLPCLKPFRLEMQIENDCSAQTQIEKKRVCYALPGDRTLVQFEVKLATMCEGDRSEGRVEFFRNTSLYSCE